MNPNPWTVTFLVVALYVVMVYIPNRQSGCHCPPGYRLYDKMCTPKAIATLESGSQALPARCD
jgi:hypothetical protein